MGQDNVFDPSDPAYSPFRYYNPPPTRSEFSLEEPVYASRPVYKDEESRSSDYASGDSFRRGSTCRVLLCVSLVISFIGVVVAAITLAVLLSKTPKPRRIPSPLEEFQSSARIYGVEFNDKLLDNTSRQFADMEKDFCLAVEQMFTENDSPVKHEFEGCKVVAFSKGSVVVKFTLKLRSKQSGGYKEADRIHHIIEEYFANKIKETGPWQKLRFDSDYIDRFVKIQPIKIESSTSGKPDLTTTEAAKVDTTQTKLTIAVVRQTTILSSTHAATKLAPVLNLTVDEISTDKEVLPTTNLTTIRISTQDVTPQAPATETGTTMLDGTMTNATDAPAVMIDQHKQISTGSPDAVVDLGVTSYMNTTQRVGTDAPYNGTIPDVSQHITSSLDQTSTLTEVTTATLIESNAASTVVPETLRPYTDSTDTFEYNVTDYSFINDSETTQATGVVNVKAATSAPTIVSDTATSGSTSDIGLTTETQPVAEKIEATHTTDNIALIADSNPTSSVIQLETTDSLQDKWNLTDRQSVTSHTYSKSTEVIQQSTEQLTTSSSISTDQSTEPKTLSDFIAKSTAPILSSNDQDSTIQTFASSTAGNLVITSDQLNDTIHTDAVTESLTTADFVTSGQSQSTASALADILATRTTDAMVTESPSRVHEASPSPSVKQTSTGMHITISTVFSTSEVINKTTALSTTNKQLEVLRSRIDEHRPADIPFTPLEKKQTTEQYITQASVGSENLNGSTETSTEDVATGFAEAITQSVIQGSAETTTEAVVNGSAEATTQNGISSSVEATTQDVVKGFVEATTQDVVKGLAEATTRDVMNGPEEATAQDVMKGIAESTTQDVMNGLAEATTRDVVKDLAEATTRDAMNGTVEATTQDLMNDSAEATTKHMVEIIKDRLETTVQPQGTSNGATAGETSTIALHRDNVTDSPEIWKVWSENVTKDNYDPKVEIYNASTKNPNITTFSEIKTGIPHVKDDGTISSVETVQETTPIITESYNATTSFRLSHGKSSNESSILIANTEMPSYITDFTTYGVIASTIEQQPIEKTGSNRTSVLADDKFTIKLKTTEEFITNTIAKGFVTTAAMTEVSEITTAMPTTTMKDSILDTTTTRLSSDKVTEAVDYVSPLVVNDRRLGEPTNILDYVKASHTIQTGPLPSNDNDTSFVSNETVSYTEEQTRNASTKVSAEMLENLNMNISKSEIAVTSDTVNISSTLHTGDISMQTNNVVNLSKEITTTAYYRTSVTTDVSINATLTDSHTSTWPFFPNETFVYNASDYNTTPLPMHKENVTDMSWAPVEAKTIEMIMLSENTTVGASNLTKSTKHTKQTELMPVQTTQLINNDTNTVGPETFTQAHNITDNTSIRFNTAMPAATESKYKTLLKGTTHGMTVTETTEGQTNLEMTSEEAAIYDRITSVVTSSTISYTASALDNTTSTQLDGTNVTTVLNDSTIFTRFQDRQKSDPLDSAVMYTADNITESASQTYMTTTAMTTPKAVSTEFAEISNATESLGNMSKRYEANQTVYTIYNNTKTVVKTVKKDSSTLANLIDQFLSENSTLPPEYYENITDILDYLYNMTTTAAPIDPAVDIGATNVNIFDAGRAGSDPSEPVDKRPMSIMDFAASSQGASSDVNTASVGESQTGIGDSPQL